MLSTRVFAEEEAVTTLFALVVVMYLNRATGGAEPGGGLERGQSEEAAEGARVDSQGRRRHATGE